MRKTPKNRRNKRSDTQAWIIGPILSNQARPPSVSADSITQMQPNAVLRASGIQVNDNLAKTNTVHKGLDTCQPLRD